MIHTLTDAEWVRLEQLIGPESSEYLKDKYYGRVTLKEAILGLNKDTSIYQDFSVPFNEIPLYLKTGSPVKKAILLFRLEVGR